MKKILPFFLLFFPSVYAGGQNVGINTDGSTPSTLLHTKNTIAGQNNYLRIENTQGGFQSAMQLYNSGTVNADWIQYIPGGTTDLRFYRGADRVTFLAGGNVGIGSTSSAYQLDLGGGTLGFGASNTRTEYRDDAGAMGGQSGFYQTAAPAPAANWPAGAASWWHLLDIRHSNTGNNYSMQFAGSFFDQNLYFRKTNNNAAQAWSQILTTSNGVTNSCGTVNYLPRMTTATNIGCSQVYDNGTNVGIGTTTLNYKLSVNGQVANIQDAGAYSQTTLQTWGLYSPGAMYIEPGAGSNFYLVPNNWSQSLTTSIYGQVGIGASPVNVYATDLWIDENIHVQGNENLNQGGRGRMRIGTAWGYMGLYTDGSSTGAGNDLVLGASSGKVRIGCDGCGQGLYVSGDFENQEVAYGQSNTNTGGTWSVRSSTITTHGTGVNGSIVQIYGEIDYYKTGSSTYVVVALYRDGGYLSEVSQYSIVNEDMTVQFSWMDEPAAGSHTYELYVRYPAGGLTYYGTRLYATEIKR